MFRLLTRHNVKELRLQQVLPKKFTTVLKSIKAAENALRIGLRIRNKSRSENHNDIVSLRKLSTNAC